MIYFLSDTHFYHEKIIGYCNRPFNSVEEMNNFIVRMWNSVVKEYDEVYFLGDFALNCTKEQVKDTLSSLRGRKILIKGNHDKYSNSFYLDAGFLQVHKSYILPYKEFSFVLTHIPEHSNWHSKNSNWKPIKVENKVNIHGHLHNNKSELLPDWAYFNVGVENINYTPILLEDIYKSVNKAELTPEQVLGGLGRTLSSLERELLINKNLFTRFSKEEQQDFDNKRLLCGLKTLDLLKEILIEEPSLRLGQLWTNIFSSVDKDMFYLESSESLRIVEEYKTRAK